MSDKSRCPQCSAVIPVGATWCSLCYSDFRPPDTRGSELNSASGHEAAQVAANRARRAARTTGRHSADAPIHRTVSPDYATISSVESRPVVDAEIPLETQLWADQVLAELRMSEPAMPDPESAPGGKWGMAAAGTAIVVVCLLAVYTLLGFFVGR